MRQGLDRWRVSTGAGELVVELRPWFLLRTSELPVRLLDGLGHPGLLPLTERLFTADRRLAAERDAFQRRAAALREVVLELAAEQRAHARRCLRSVRAGMPLIGEELRLLESLGLGEQGRRWQCAVVAAGSGRAAGRSAHAAAWLATRRAVAEAYDDDRVRRAALLADPAFHQAIGRHPLARRPGDGTARRSRLLTATAHRLLRRLASGAGDGGPAVRARFEPDGRAGWRVIDEEGAGIGGPAPAGLREALSVALPLWCLARTRVLSADLARLVAEAVRVPGQEVVRLAARDVAGLWAGERPEPASPAPELTAVGTDPESAAWLLSGVRDDGQGVAHSGQVDLGERTPRIMIGDLIYQRARWRLRLPEERGADAFDRWLALHRLRRHHGLPRHVFVRHPAGPCPFHVDFCDPLAVEDLARREPAEVLITEMLPAPGQFWWRADGQEQAAELRLSCRIERERG
ncbi:hypothetical protein [Nonomuraea insulae]|uniref:Lantibiotic dehydratase N-terminal domain-containing protein n=1 Tax=Nonomuraea insulae TaxID=1616787 RepID=A0ABW1DDL0_9ACTN